MLKHDDNSVDSEAHAEDAFHADLKFTDDGYVDLDQFSDAAMTDEDEAIVTEALSQLDLSVVTDLLPDQGNGRRRYLRAGITGVLLLVATHFLLTSLGDQPLSTSTSESAQPPSTSTSESASGNLEMNDVEDVQAPLIGPDDSQVTALEVLDNGAITAAYDNGEIHLWRSVTPANQDSDAEFVLDSGDPVTNMTQLDSGEILITQRSGEARLWLSNTTDRAGGVSEGAFSFALDVGPVGAIQAHRNGRLVAANVGGTITVWDIASPLPERWDYRGHLGEQVTALAVTEDGRIVSADKTGEIHVWRTDDLGPGTAVVADTDPVTAMEVFDSGDRLVTAHDNGVIRVWDLDSGGRLTASIWSPSQVDATVTALAVTQDDHIAVAYDNGAIGILEPTTPRSVKWWNLIPPTTTPVTGEESAALNTETIIATALKQLPDGRMVAATTDGKIRIWSLNASARNPSQGALLERSPLPVPVTID